MIKKAYLFLHAVAYYICLKMRYGRNIEMNLINSIRGKLSVELLNASNISIGSFLMVRGPLYLKCTENASIQIGDECFFNNNCSITAANKITIGNQCKFANNLVIIDHDHAIKGNHATAELVAKPIQIDDNVWVGANCTILKGVHIGEGSIVAAGAVVTKDVPDHTIVAGVPAKEIRRI